MPSSTTVLKRRRRPPSGPSTTQQLSSELCRTSEDGCPTSEDGERPETELPSFAAHLNAQRVAADKLTSLALLVLLAPAWLHVAPTCSQQEKAVGMLFNACLAALLAWAQLAPGGYAAWRELAVPAVRLGRWLLPCRRTGPLALLLLNPIELMQGALGYRVRLPWGALVLAGEVVLRLPAAAAMCVAPELQEGSAPAAAAVAALRAWLVQLFPGTEDSGGACLAVVLFAQLAVGLALPLALQAAQERLAFAAFYKLHGGTVRCDSCTAVYLSSVEEAEEEGEEGSGSRSRSGAGRSSGGRGAQLGCSRWQRWVQMATLGMLGYITLWLIWDAANVVAQLTGGTG